MRTLLDIVFQTLDRMGLKYRIEGEKSKVDPA
jgi:hypothetical protein